MAAGRAFKKLNQGNDSRCLVGNIQWLLRGDVAQVLQISRWCWLPHVQVDQQSRFGSVHADIMRAYQEVSFRHMNSLIWDAFRLTGTAGRR